MRVIGVDPGPIPGIVRLTLDSTALPGSGVPVKLLKAEVLQVTPSLLTGVLSMLSPLGVTPAVIAAERFVVGPRAGRSSTPQAGTATRLMMAEIEAWASRFSHRFIERSAAEVKPWATDERLEAAGLLALTKGMRHARDAARHALFCAVKDFGLPDPLSRRGGVR